LRLQRALNRREGELAFDARWSEDVVITEDKRRATIFRPAEGTDIELQRSPADGTPARWRIELDGFVVVDRESSGTWRIDASGLADHIFVTFAGRHERSRWQMRRLFRLAQTTCQSVVEILELEAASGARKG
jgi:hypothetical protein